MHGCLSNNKHHTLGGLNNEYSFLTILDVGKSKIKVLADLVSGKDPLTGLQVAVLCPHMVERSSFSCLFFKGQ